MSIILLFNINNIIILNINKFYNIILLNNKNLIIFFKNINFDKI
jgi:hypothetical protein